MLDSSRRAGFEQACTGAEGQRANVGRIHPNSNGRANASAFKFKRARTAGVQPRARFEFKFKFKQACAAHLHQPEPLVAVGPQRRQPGRPQQQLLPRPGLSLNRRAEFKQAC